MTFRLLGAALSVFAIAFVSGCGGAEERSVASGERLGVVAAFYPLQYAAEQIGGDDVRVTGLTKPGVEPHDLELSAKDVARTGGADLVVYLRGFQGAVDDAVETQAKDQRFDVAAAARLQAATAHDEHPSETRAGEGSTGEGTTTEPHTDEVATDPHFWLDPNRYADVGDALASQLGARHPRKAKAFTARAAAFRERLSALDRQFAAGLKNCRSRDLVTSHSAFGYLADAYGLHHEGITGLSPESEPSPAALARIAAFVKAEGVQTVYAETLVSHRVAETLAREAGAKVAVLDPVEGLTRQSAGKDYFEVMEANLTTLRGGLGCT